jgi:hypothetical protein
MSEAWMPIKSAPKNGVCVLLKLKDPIPEPSRLDLCRWSGIIFVARHTGFEEPQPMPRLLQFPKRETSNDL